MCEHCHRLTLVCNADPHGCGSKTLLGRTCGHCGALDCTRHGTVRVDRPVVVEGNYWDVCGRCGYVLAYCGCGKRPSGDLG